MIIISAQILDAVNGQQVEIVFHIRAYVKISFAHASFGHTGTDEMIQQILFIETDGLLHILVSIIVVFRIKDRRIIDIAGG